MKTDLKYLFKISLILTVAIFVIERLLSAEGFNLPMDELLRVFGLHFMYAFVLTIINAYFFQILNFHFHQLKLTKHHLHRS